MTRLRWSLILLAAAALVMGVGSASVLARSSATYTNRVLSGTMISSGNHNAPAETGHWWVGYGHSATWTFSNVSALGNALGGSVYLNVDALSAGPHWGAGFASTIRVDVTGAVAGTFTTTLANPWKPHVAYNETPGVGWVATGSLQLPRRYVAGAGTLTVQISLPASGNHVGFTADSLTIGYATTP